MCALLANLNRLSTKDRLSKWNASINKMCVLCNCEEEDRDHLFFKCSYSSQMWNKISEKATTEYELPNVLNFVAAMKHDNEMLNHLINVAVTALIRNLWCERNARVFNNIITPLTVRLNLLMQDIRMLFMHTKIRKEFIKDKEIIFANFDLRVESKSDYG